MVYLLRLENIKERWKKKTERYIQSIKNIYKLKWLTVRYSFHLFIVSSIQTIVFNVMLKSV